MEVVGVEAVVVSWTWRVEHTCRGSTAGSGRWARLCSGFVTEPSEQSSDKRMDDKVRYWRYFKFLYTQCSWSKRKNLYSLCDPLTSHLAPLSSGKILTLSWFRSWHAHQPQFCFHTLLDWDIYKYSRRNEEFQVCTMLNDYVALRLTFPWS